MSDLKNKIDFFLREKTKFSRKNYSPKPQEVSDLIPDSEYDLTILKNDITRLNCSENLYILDILDKYFPIFPHEDLKILDIGSKNWFYARGEYIYFKNACHHLEMTGVELDAYRLCWNLYSRKEIAKYNIKYLPFTRYIADNFLNINGCFDYITWFLPFVGEFQHKQWGLPMKYFNPAQMLAHAKECLTDGGSMFIVNQGESEYWLQKQLCKDLGLQYQEIGLIRSDFYQYRYPRYALIVH